MTENALKSARWFLCCWEDNIVGITSCIYDFVYFKLFKDGKKVWRGHRTVILPDYQGIGMGNAMVKMMAQLVNSWDCHYIGATSHPSLIKYRLKRPKEWKCLTKLNDGLKIRRTRTALNMKSYVGTAVSFLYVGEDMGKIL